MEEQRYRRGDVLAASGKELILKFATSVLIHGIFLNFFTLWSKSLYFVFCFFTAALPGLRSESCILGNASNCPGSLDQVSCLGGLFAVLFCFLRAGTGGTFITLTCASSLPGWFYGKLATFRVVVTGPSGGAGRRQTIVRGDRAARRRAERRCCFWWCRRWWRWWGIHASRRGFVLSRPQS